MPGCMTGSRKCVLDMVKGSAAVFQGKAISIQQQEDPALYKAVFSVSTSWKGISSQLIEVFYYDLAANGCPFSLQKGTSYTFFAWVSAGKLFVGECNSAEGYERYFPKGKRWRIRN